MRWSAKKVQRKFSGCQRSWCSLAGEEQKEMSQLFSKSKEKFKLGSDRSVDYHSTHCTARPEIFLFFQTRFVLDTVGQNNYQRRSISEGDAVPSKEIFRQCRLFLFWYKVFTVEEVVDIILLSKFFLFFFFISFSPLTVCCWYSQEKEDWSRENTVVYGVLLAIAAPRKK